MSTAVSAAAGNQRLALRTSSFLRKPGQRVEFAQNTDDGLSFAITAKESSGHAAKLILHREAFGFQNPDIGSGGLMLLHR